MGESGAKRLGALESRNRRLKKAWTESMLEFLVPGEAPRKMVYTSYLYD